MDVQEPNTASLSELNLEQFLRNVGDAVERFGHEYIPDSTGEMKYLPKYPHNFTLTSVLDEHKSRLTEPTAVMNSTGMETSTSKQARFKI